MLRIVDNEDGTKSLTINSADVRRLFDERIPDFKKLVQDVDTPGVKATVEFIKAVIA